MGVVAVLTIQCTDSASAPAGRLEPLVRALHAARAATAAQDQPYEPVETVELVRASLLAPWSGDPVLLLTAEDADGGLVGHALLELPAHDNPHLGTVDLHVSAGHRRRGAGRALLAAAADALRDRGRRTLLAEARVDSPMAAFLAAAGAQCALVDVRRHQPIAALALDRVEALRREAQRHARGYVLAGWLGATPPDRRDRMAEVAHSLNDAPLGDLDYDDEVWDAERLIRRDRFVTTAGLRLHTLVADAPDGTAAGYTEVAVSADGTYGWQWNTGVAPAHRGHRLGLLLKAAMVLRLRAQEPGLRVVSTWNAESNDRMIAINEALGYRPVDRSAAWQLAL